MSRFGTDMRTTRTSTTAMNTARRVAGRRLKPRRETLRSSPPLRAKTNKADRKRTGSEAHRFALIWRLPSSERHDHGHYDAPQSCGRSQNFCRGEDGGAACREPRAVGLDIGL